MLSEIVFVMDKLHATHVARRIIAFDNRNRRQKGDFSTRQSSYSYSRQCKKVVPRCRNRIITMASTEPRSEHERGRRILARKVYDQAKPSLEDTHQPP